MPTKSWQNHLKKLLTYDSWELLFSLCSPDCPKQHRTSFPFYELFYPTISCRISALLSLPQLSLKKSYFLQPLLSFLLALAWACAGVSQKHCSYACYKGVVKNNVMTLFLSCLTCQRSKLENQKWAPFQWNNIWVS